MQYVLGVDLGASQRAPTTAFVVVAYHFEQPNKVWVIKSEAKAGMIPSTIADEIKAYLTNTSQDHLENMRIVMDAGALGMGYVQEMRQRYNIPVEPARKQDKLAYRKLMNGDLQRGTLKIVTDTNKELCDELRTLIWDEKGRDAHPSCNDHLTDAMLYAWREAKHWLATAPDIMPKSGTRQRAEWEDRRAEEQEIAGLHAHGDWF
jgi:hypothetical protein